VLAAATAEDYGYPNFLTHLSNATETFRNLMALVFSL
jgi:hypothetical protein